MQQETEAPEQTAEDVAVLAIARGLSQNEAAGQAGVHRTTVNRWMREGGFRERVAAARRDILSQATGKLGDRILSAIDTLANLLESESEATKLGAAKAMLAALLPLNLQQNLEDRIANLEATR
ncbi:hypothetical protein Pan44_26960 [Caulifigura coniformis]|uniref:Homeodomain phBC6A51-type domain-containing protein n=1 Tax=Caulifigura coniformis TaxID=2527983 RepID=A0A517SEV1_9PLAN|nr:hypothetical protein [Caulifigura coniformis]QDT54661.1 hypothetical protein Pan44_26960 [Caulifigura coniformis]